MSSLAHKQAAWSYQRIVQVAQRMLVIRAMHLDGIDQSVIDRAVRNGVLQRTDERGVWLSLQIDPRG